MNRNLLRPLTRGFVPFLETVTFFSRNAPGGQQFTEYTLYRAQHEESEKDTVTPLLKKKARVWNLFQTDLDNAEAPTPKPADVVRDASGVRWTVQSVDFNEQNFSYSLECLQEV